MPSISAIPLQRRPPALRMAGATVILAVLCGGAAAADDRMPPPGLYRVQSADAITRHSEGSTVRQQIDDQGGTATLQGRGQAPRILRSTDTGAREICIGANASAPMPMADPSCVTSKPVQTPEGLSSTAKCNFADVTTKVRQLDAKHWQFTGAVTMKIPAAAGGGISSTSSMVSHWTRVGDNCKPAPTAALPKAPG